MAGEREKWWWGREEMRESKEEATARFYTGNMASRVRPHLCRVTVKVSAVFERGTSLSGQAVHRANVSKTNTAKQPARAHRATFLAPFTMTATYAL